MNKDIFLTNSYGGKKEHFKPIDENNIKRHEQIGKLTTENIKHINALKKLFLYDTTNLQGGDFGTFSQVDAKESKVIGDFLVTENILCLLSLLCLHKT